MTIADETPDTRRKRMALQKLTRAMGELLDKRFSLREQKIGFALTLFDFAPNGHIAYCSNGQRSDMRQALRELLQRLDLEAEAAAADHKRGD